MVEVMKIGAADVSEFVLFSEDEVKALEDRIVDRDTRGKTTAHVTCRVRGKEVQLKPEERVR